MLRIYYAHPMSWYDTPEEKTDLDALASEGTIINPNQSFFQQQVEYAKKRNFPVMDVFAEYIRDKADVVCFRRFRDGKLGAGVAREIFEAIIWGKEIWEIRGGDKYEYRYGGELRSQDRPIILDKVVSLETALNYSDTQPADIEFGDILTVAETKERIANRRL